jgi:hypothetical protein
MTRTARARRSGRCSTADPVAPGPRGGPRRCGDPRLGGMPGVRARCGAAPCRRSRGSKSRSTRVPGPAPGESSRWGSADHVYDGVTGRVSGGWRRSSYLLARSPSADLARDHRHARHRGARAGRDRPRRRADPWTFSRSRGASRWPWWNRSSAGPASPSPRPSPSRRRSAWGARTSFPTSRRSSRPWAGAPPPPRASSRCAIAGGQYCSSSPARPLPVHGRQGHWPASSRSSPTIPKRAVCPAVDLGPWRRAAVTALDLHARRARIFRQNVEEPEALPRRMFTC